MSQLDRRRVLRMFVALGVAGTMAPALAACSRLGAQPDQAVKGPIKIGLLAPRSGPYKVIGDDLTYGFKLYLKLNGNKLAGYPVDLVVSDEGDTAATGLAAATTLLQQEPLLALTGVANPNVITAIKDAVETAQIPLIGSNASSSGLQNAKYIWRTSYVSDEPGRSLGRYVTQVAGAGPVYVISADDVAAREGVKGFLGMFTGKLQGPTYVTPGKMNFQQYLTQIRNQGAKVVFCFFADAQAVAFVKQYAESGLLLPVYAPGFLTEGAALKAVGGSALGVYTSTNYSPDLDNTTNRRFTSEYDNVYHLAPTTYAMASYDAAAVLDKAIDVITGYPTPQLLNLALARIGSIDSPRGTWQFNQNRTPQQKWHLRQVKADATGVVNSIVTELGTLG